MYGATTDYKNILKGVSSQNIGYVVLYDMTASTNSTVTGANISKFEITNSACQNDKVLGNIAQGELKIEFVGDITASLDLTHVYEILPYVGVYLTASTTEYVPFQRFIVQSFKYDHATNKTSVIAYDYAIKLNKDFVDANAYPKTLLAFLQNICTQAGLTLQNTTIFNGTFSIATKPVFDSNSLKEVLSRVCELALSYARINRDNKIELVQLSTLKSTTYAETITKDHAREFSTGQDAFKTLGINTLVLKLDNVVTGENVSASDATMVSTDGSVEMTITDNPFIWNEALKTSVITAMLAEIKGFKYRVAECISKLAPYFDLGDIVRYQTAVDEVDIISPVLSFNLLFDGAIKITVGSKAMTLTDTEYKNEGSLTKRVKRTEIMVDKLNGTIQLTAAREVGIVVGELYTGTSDLNIIKDSASFDTGFVTSLNVATTTIERLTDRYGNPTRPALLIAFNSPTALTSYFRIEGVVTKPSTAYTFSCWITRQAYSDIEYRFLYNNTVQATATTVAGTWVYVSFTFTSLADVSVYDFIEIKSNYAGANGVWLMYPQLEEGTTATEWKPQASTELVGAKYIFGSSKAMFYSDGQEWYDDSGVLQVYFDTANHRYVFKGRIESSSGLIAGWTVASTYLSKGSIKLDSANERIYLNSSAYFYTAASGRIGVSGVMVTNALFPVSDDTYDLGLSTNRWSTIWCTDSSLNGSDLRLKEEVTPINKGIDLILNLNPVQYKWKARENGRFHYGLVAQEVKQVMDSLGIDSGIYADPTIKPDWDRNNPDEENAEHYLALRYTELIAPLIQTVQYLNSEILTLKEKINA